MGLCCGITRYSGGAYAPLCPARESITRFFLCSLSMEISYVANMFATMDMVSLRSPGRGMGLGNPFSRPCDGQGKSESHNERIISQLLGSSGHEGKKCGSSLLRVQRRALAARTLSTLFCDLRGWEYSGVSMVWRAF